MLNKSPIAKIAVKNVGMEKVSQDLGFQVTFKYISSICKGPMILLSSTMNEL